MSMRRTRPKIAISENVTTGNINQRIVEVLQHDMDARESCKHLLVRFAVLCHGMPWGSDQALDVVNVKLYKIFIYIYICMFPISGYFHRARRRWLFLHCPQACFPDLCR